MHADGKSTLVSVSKWNSGKVNSIEENEETVGKKDIEELETQISIECIKVYKYLLEIETFEADGTVNEVKIG